MRFFGTDMVRLPGTQLPELMREYHAFSRHEVLTRLAACDETAHSTQWPLPETSFPEELVQSGTVALIYDATEGLEILAGFGDFERAFIDPEALSEDHYRQRVLDYLDDDSVSPLPFRRMAEFDPIRAGEVLRLVLPAGGSTGTVRARDSCVSGKHRSSGGLNCLGCCRSASGWLPTSPRRPEPAITDSGCGGGDNGPELTLVKLLFAKEDLRLLVDPARFERGRQPRARLRTCTRTSGAWSGPSSTPARPIRRWSTTGALPSPPSATVPTDSRRCSASTQWQWACPISMRTTSDRMLSNCVAGGAHTSSRSALPPHDELADSGHSPAPPSLLPSPGIGSGTSPKRGPGTPRNDGGAERFRILGTLLSVCCIFGMQL